MREKRKIIDEDSSEYKEALEIWENFCYEIKHKNRFWVNQTEAGRRLLEHFEEIKRAHSVSATSNCILYRARTGDLKNVLEKASKERINEEFNAPPEKYAGDGRGNAKGISYLYLTTDINTAINEVRPSIGEDVTVAEIIIKKENLSKIFSFKLFEQWDTHMRSNLIKNSVSRNLMYIINKKMSEKVGNSIEYVPLQFIVEYIKQLGFSGFSFDSSLDDGHNYILFSSEFIEVKKIHLYIVKDVEHKYEVLEVK